MEQLETPVAFIVFNRPFHTAQVFQAIAQVKPKKLFIIADGPRATRPEEAAQCKEVRRIATSVTWPCELKLDFASKNLGCRGRVVSGLNELFTRVEEAIILEDDILPRPSFFRFCEEMLERFRHDERISMVTGFNVVQDSVKTAYSYYFSELTHIWGWATWRRSWVRYDEHLSRWPEIKGERLLSEIFQRKREEAYWTRIFDKMHAGTGPDTWDYQWMYTNLMGNTIAVAPRVNLVENLGFGPEATHTLRAQDAPQVSVQDMSFPLSHPPCIVPRRSWDRRDQERSGGIVGTVPQRIYRRLERIFAR